MRERCGLGRRLVYTPCLLPNKAIKRMFDSTHACTTLDGFRLKMAKSWKTSVLETAVYTLLEAVCELNKVQ